MPCYDPFNGNDSGKRIEYKEIIKKVDNPKDKQEIIKLTDTVKRLEAGLCALISELDRKGIANEIISQASKSGLINLMDFWEAHSKEDETRIARALHHFSEHEQIVMKKILNSNKNL
jgi:DNA-binding MarR family transcriptional regulator